MAEATTRKRKRAKRVPSNQKYIDGVEPPPRIKEIDKAALKYRDVRDEWLALQAQAEQMEKDLRDLMHQHRISVYPIPDTELEVALVTVEEKARVRKRKLPKAPE